MQSTMEESRALKAAAEWYARLCAEDASQADHVLLEQWLAADPAHRWAWHRVETLRQQLLATRNHPSANLAVDAVDYADRQVDRERRNLLRGMLLFAGVGTAGWLGYQHKLQEAWLADVYTRRGEVKPIQLADGSTLILNTASSVDVDYSLTARRVHLRRGEILVETAKDTLSRPFIIVTRQGTVEALGTRFSVRELEDRVDVQVFEHQVAITAKGGEPQILDAGQAADFGAAGIFTKPVRENGDAWTRLTLAVNAMPLDIFVAEISRYRNGVIRCDPALARFRISGVFRLDNTEQALQALEKSFPVTVRRFTRYWVSIESQT